MILLTLKLILAHFIGDFMLQPSHWVDDKLEKKWKSKFLYAHMAIHLTALLLLLQFQNLGIVAFIVITHYLIDLGKLAFTNSKNYRRLFTLDQLLHLLIIAIAVYWIYPYELEFQSLFGTGNLLLVTFLVFVTFVAGILMRMLLAPYIAEVIKDDSEEGGSLKNAGKYIGMLERLFVFGFILLNQWAAIGLLIAAKSVFRFGDLNKGKNRKLTEYVLIGTLLSFGLAIISGMAYKYLQELL